MIRMSSLPTAQYCGKTSEVGAGVDSTQALRSTCFHAYCETGKWPELIHRLPPNDVEEIKKWQKPSNLSVELDGKHILSYKDSIKESRVALDKDLNYLDIPKELEQYKIEEQFSNCLASGHVDMYWVLNDVVIVEDIKSSVFAVKDRTHSIQLMAYGLSLAKKHKLTKFVPCIWDASDGKHYVGNVYSIDDFNTITDIENRILNAYSNKGGNYVTGEHCSWCWKRQSCKAHLSDIPDDNVFKPVFEGTANDKQILEALIAAKKLEDLSRKAKEGIQTLVKLRGPVYSEDKSKMYCGALRNGRKSLSQELVMQELGVDSLDKFMKEGDPYMVFDWRNAK